MKIELVNDLQNPTAFFEANGKLYALDLVDHILYGRSESGAIGEVSVDLEFDVSQDWENETTEFIFPDFTIAYCGDVITVS